MVLAFGGEGSDRASRCCLVVERVETCASVAVGSTEEVFGTEHGAQRLKSADKNRTKGLLDSTRTWLPVEFVSGGLAKGLLDSTRTWLAVEFVSGGLEG